MIGSPPNCRPECIVNSDCELNRACIQQKCQDPCLGNCGIRARCQVINHSAICSCPAKTTGDPFVRCIEVTLDPVIEEKPKPCTPSKCGPNSICREINSREACSCMPGMIGTPPNCRPECTHNNECHLNMACINYRCKNPCINACGSQADCKVINHQAACYCKNHFTGDPFIECRPIPSRFK